MAVAGYPAVADRLWRAFRSQRWWVQLLGWLFLWGPLAALWLIRWPSWLRRTLAAMLALLALAVVVSCATGSSSPQTTPTREAQVVTRSGTLDSPAVAPSPATRPTPTFASAPAQSLARQPITDDVRLVEFCVKAASDDYVTGAILHEVQIRALVRMALAESGIESTVRVDRYARHLALVNPYLAYSLFYTYEDGVPGDTEILAWFPSFVRAFVTPDSPRVPLHMRLRYADRGAFLTERLTTSGEPSKDFLFRTCSRLVGNGLWGDYMLFRGMIYIVIGPSLYLDGIFDTLQRVYEDYVIAASDRNIPRDMTFVEYIAKFDRDGITLWFPGADWERIAHDWAAERGAGEP